MVKDHEPSVEGSDEPKQDSANTVEDNQDEQMEDQAPELEEQPVEKQ